jgi:HlyD family secretion protein
MKKKKKKIIIGIVIVVALIAVISNLTRNKSNAINVNAEKVTAGDITEEVSASGWVQPQDRVNVTSEVTAEIIAVPVKEGQTVRKGDLLVLLDTVQLHTDVQQSRYSLDEMVARTEASKSLFNQAEEEYQRQQRLFERNLTSETAFKNAEYAYMNGKYGYEAMENQKKQAEARYSKAVDLLRKTRILSPMDGVVTYLDAEEGEIAAAQTPYTQGKTLMTISNLAAFEVEVDVDETEIIKVSKGQEAKIEVDAFPDTVFAGEVVEIGNTAVMTGVGTQEQSTNFKVKVLFKDTDVDIRPGMSATVDIVTNTKENILKVPYGSIVMRTLDADSLERSNKDSSTGVVAAALADTAGDKEVLSGGADKKDKKKTKELKGVFIVREGAAHFLPVETGIADQKDIEIVSGLTDADTVISGPFKTLRTLAEGDEVKIVETPTSGAL